MSKRRLDKLEGSLGPKQAVLHWLGDAHAAGSLPDYVASIIDQPEAAQPFVALPRRVQDAVWQSMRGEPKSAIKTATRDATADTIFLLRLVVGLNTYVEAVLRVESLRHAALYWWARALDPTDKTKLPPEWHAGVATLEGTIRGTEDALRATEARYLDGHDVLFPEMAAAWRQLCTTAESTSDSPADDSTVAAKRDVERVVHMARADGLEAGGRIRAADQVARRVLRSTARSGGRGTRQ